MAAFHAFSAGRCGESQLQVSAILDFTTEFSEFVGNRVHHVSVHIGNEYAGADSDNLRIAQIQKLARYDNPVSAGFHLKLHVDLIRVSSIEHLACASAG